MTRPHSYASLKQKRFTSQKNRNFNFTPEKKHTTYADMYTCTRTHALNALALRFRKGQKGVTDKHTYIRVRSHTQTHTQIRTHSHTPSKQERFTS